MQKCKKLLYFFMAIIMFSTLYVPQQVTAETVSQKEICEINYVYDIDYPASQNIINFNAEELSFLQQCCSDYGKQTLSSKNQALYEKILQIFNTFYNNNTDITQSTVNGETAYIIGTVNITGYNKEDLFRTYIYVHYDNPLLYYINSSQIFYDNTYLYLAIFDDFINGSIRNTVQSKLESKIAKYEAQESDYKTALQVYNGLKTEVQYGTSTSHICHTIAGWNNGTVVCDGYASMLAATLNYVNVNAIIVTGFAQPTGSTPSESSGHAWNMIKIDEQWYYVDLTWDDKQEGNSYFCKGKSFLSTHMNMEYYQFDSGAVHYCYAVPEAPEDYQPEQQPKEEPAAQEKSTTASAPTTEIPTTPTTTEYITTESTTEAPTTEITNIPIPETTVQATTQVMINSTTTEMTVSESNILPQSVTGEQTTSEIMQPITDTVTVTKNKKYSLPKAKIIKLKNKTIYIKKKSGCYYQILYKGKKYMLHTYKKKLWGHGYVKVRYAKYIYGKWQYGSWSKQKRI